MEHSPLRQIRSRLLPGTMVLLMVFVVVAALPQAVRAATASPGDLLISDYWGDKVHVYDTETLTLKGTFLSGPDGPVGLTYLPDGDLIVAASKADEVYRYDGQTGAFKGVVPTSYVNNPRGLTSDRTGTLWIPALDDDYVIGLDPATGHELYRWAVSRPMAVAVGHNRLYVASQTDGRVVHFDIPTRQYLGVLVSGLGTNPQGLTIAPDGNVLVNASQLGLYRIDWQTGAILNSRPGSGPEGIAIGPDGLVYMREGPVLGLHPVTLEVLRTNPSSAAGSHGIAFTPLPTILSMNATYLDTSFAATGGEHGRGELTVSDAADIVIENADGQITYAGGTVRLVASLFDDRSADGIATGDFRGGTVTVANDMGIEMLTGDLVSLELQDVLDGAGLLSGPGRFEVTGGYLADAFGEQFGDIVQITFDIDPAGIDDFSGAFTGFSNITLTPIPEPVTLTLLTLGGLAMLRRRKRGACK